jgi:hypothetical protein
MELPMTKAFFSSEKTRNESNGFEIPKKGLLYSPTPKRVEKDTKDPKSAVFDQDPPLFYPRHRSILPSSAWKFPFGSFRLLKENASDILELLVQRARKSDGLFDLNCGFRANQLGNSEYHSCMKFLAEDFNRLRNAA